jgi:hypothetical protein
MLTKDDSIDNLTLPRRRSTVNLDSKHRAAYVLASFIAGIVAWVGVAQSEVSTSQSTSLQVTSVAARVPNLYETQQRVDEYIRSGEYDRDVIEVIAARRR